MKKSKFTEAQIVFAIKQFETGTRVDEISRQMVISQATFFNWKEKYGSMGVSELRKLRQLEEVRSLYRSDFFGVGSIGGFWGVGIKIRFSTKIGIWSCYFSINFASKTFF